MRSPPRGNTARLLAEKKLLYEKSRDFTIGIEIVEKSTQEE